MIPWAQNDELFKKELIEGQLWQNHVGNFFQLCGLAVMIPPLKIRESIADAEQWSDSKDLIVEGRVIEVKARNERFTTPASFPYDTVFIDTVSGYQAKKQKPTAYVNISRKTGAMIAIPSGKPDAWKIEKKFDRIRRIWDEFYLAEKKKFCEIDILIDQLRKKS